MEKVNFVKKSLGNAKIVKKSQGNADFIKELQKNTQTSSNDQKEKKCKILPKDRVPSVPSLKYKHHFQGKNFVLNTVLY